MCDTLKKAKGSAERELALIEALQTRYSDDPAAESAALDAAYSAAMQAVADRFPDEPQVQALAAEAMRRSMIAHIQKQLNERATLWSAFARRALRQAGSRACSWTMRSAALPWTSS